MRIDYNRRFIKALKKLDRKHREKVILTVELFQSNPFHVSLRNHSLHGEMHGKRAISVTGDIHIVFEEREGYTYVLMLDVGSHSQVY